MKLRALLIGIILSITTTGSFAQMKRQSYPFPNANGYKVLKADLHLHTVFSDGEVWPTIRVEEAWVEDLDVIAISEHIEYLEHKGDINYGNHDRAWEIAKDKAESLGITLIKSCEITRPLPVGHINLIGIEDANAFEKFYDKSKKKTDTVGVYAALKEAKRQNAFIQWNHPGYPTLHWGDVQKNYIKEGLINGIEIINGGKYVPESFDWCLEYNLAITSNTDAHTTMALQRLRDNSKTMTLILAKSNSQEDVLEALHAGRTAGLWRDRMYGKKEIVSEIIKGALNVTIEREKGKEQGNIIIKNGSGMPFVAEVVGMSKNIKMWAGQTMVFDAKSETLLNGKISGNKGLYVTLKFENVYINSKETLTLNIPITVK